MPALKTETLVLLGILVATSAALIASNLKFPKSCWVADRAFTWRHFVSVPKFVSD